MLAIKGTKQSNHAQRPLKRRINIVVVDDHPLVRRGLSQLLQSDKGFAIVGEASDGEAAMATIAQTRPDIVLLDISMPTMDGIEFCKWLQRDYPSIAAIILTAYSGGPFLEQSIEAGAKGFILKDIGQEHLGQTIRAVAMGGTAIDPRVLTQLVPKGQENQTEKCDVRFQLTVQQVAIVKHISEGLSNKEIGCSLSLSENTVKTYVQEILQKLEAKNRAEAAMIALRKRII